MVPCLCTSMCLLCAAFSFIGLPHWSSLPFTIHSFAPQAAEETFSKFLKITSAKIYCVAVPLWGTCKAQCKWPCTYLCFSENSRADHYAGKLMESPPSSDYRVLPLQMKWLGTIWTIGPVMASLGSCCCCLGNRTICVIWALIRRKMSSCSTE